MPTVSLETESVKLTLRTYAKMDMKCIENSLQRLRNCFYICLYVRSILAVVAFQYGTQVGVALVFTIRMRCVYINFDLNDYILCYFRKSL